MNIKCILFGHSLKIGKSRAYNRKALICKNCGLQSSIWKQGAINEALLFNDRKRFISTGKRDNKDKRRKE